MFKICNSCDGIKSILDVRFTKACDNNCKFCIEKDGLNAMHVDVDKMIETAKNSNFDDMLILGGEPFLLPEKLLYFVKSVRDNFNKIYITTSLPNTFNSKKLICLNIIDVVDGLNVSFLSGYDDENNYLFDAKNKHSRIKILMMLIASGLKDKIRVNLNLMNGGIDTKEKLYSALDIFNDIGCECVKISELQYTDNLYISYEKITDVQLPNPYSHGCSTFIEPYKDLKILLRRSCFMNEKSLKAHFSDFIKIIYQCIFHKAKKQSKVLYENGKIEDEWLTLEGPC